MLKGLLSGMASAGRGLTGMGGGNGSRKGSGELKRRGVAGIFADHKASQSDGFIHKSKGKDINLPLSGSANPEHRAIARRRMAATPRPMAPEKANMDKGKKKGIFSRLMEMNPIRRAADSSHGKSKY